MQNWPAIHNLLLVGIRIVVKALVMQEKVKGGSRKATVDF